MNKTYNEYGEILLLREAADFVGVSHPTFTDWIHNGVTPMGRIVENTHYYRIGREYRFIKRQLAILFKIISE